MTKSDEEKRAAEKSDEDVELSKETLEDLDADEATAEALVGGIQTRYVNGQPQPCYNN